MTHVSARWLAWSLAGLTVALYAAIFPLFVLVNRAPVPESWDASFTLGGLLAQGHFLAFPIVGALIAWIETASFPLLLMLPVCMLLCAASLVLRFRRSEGEERQQIKWIAFAAGIIGILHLIAMVLSFITPVPSWFDAGSPLWMDLLDYAVLLSFTGIPISVGFAVLRYRLYDIDVIINRALVYGSLTATLLMVYFGGVAGLKRLLAPVVGQDGQLAVVASTLAIAALFNPLRRRVQGFVDRSFYRGKYDARETLEAFTGRLRDETDLDVLGEDLVPVVHNTMQPEHASLWLRDQVERASQETRS